MKIGLENALVGFLHTVVRGQTDDPIMVRLQLAPLEYLEEVPEYRGGETRVEYPGVQLQQCLHRSSLNVCVS